MVFLNTRIFLSRLEGFLNKSPAAGDWDFALQEVGNPPPFPLPVPMYGYRPPAHDPHTPPLLKGVVGYFVKTIPISAARLLYLRRNYPNVTSLQVLASFLERLLLFPSPLLPLAFPLSPPPPPLFFQPTCQTPVPSSLPGQRGRWRPLKSSYALERLITGGGGGGRRA